jgi:diaminohydroxyphosphoribosylaminopyrimidine deaminase/5-amino-6-(5-phosphoribosylamino)uracil reductase
MARAVELSKSGFPAPNPRVGCVIVKNGQIVAEAYHAFAGGPHAEVTALSQAGTQAVGAEVFCTLEPCNHHGRTGPCSDALVQAGVASVIYAVEDPNPRAAGGARRLLEGGVLVSSGLLATQAAAANNVFLTAMSKGRPFVCLKAAVTLDGDMALSTSESKWITGEEARAQGHRLRAEMGAVLIGLGTLRSDNPRLTARLEGAVNPPLRILLDPHAEADPASHFFSSEGEHVQVVAEGYSKEQSQITLPLDESGSFPADRLLQALWERQVTSVLVEGGPRTLSTFLRVKLFDQVELFVAPKVSGEGKRWTEGFEVATLADSLPLRFANVQQLGVDLWITAVPT